jgi:hypothetical protein
LDHGFERSKLQAAPGLAIAGALPLSVSLQAQPQQGVSRKITDPARLVRVKSASRAACIAAMQVEQESIPPVLRKSLVPEQAIEVLQI